MSRPLRSSGAGGAGTAVEAARPSAGTARALALRALVDLDRAGGRANVVVPELLGTSRLADRDRAFVTELVYGTVRMQRACDWLIDRHLRRPVEAPVRAALRLGTYQLSMLGTPAHAAVSATVSEVKGPARGLVNAVLRRVAQDVAAGLAWPTDGISLSYPDWIVTELSDALGAERARAALEQMNVPARMTVRADGYVQDQASQWAAAALGSGPGERVADLCAAPGGKATLLAYGAVPAYGGAGGPGVGAGGGFDDDRPSLVVAADLDPGRASVIAANVDRLGLGNVAVVVADGLRPPFRPGTFDRVLVDAPCSGLGVLRRRPDARWRVQPGDVPRLAELQRRMLDVALDLSRPGGRVLFSVCTLTRAETTDIDGWLAEAHPEVEAVALDLDPAWEAAGRGFMLLPHTKATDGMFLLALQASR